MKVTQNFSIAVAALSFASLAVAAPLHDDKYGFDITFPDGWTVLSPGEPIIFAGLSPDGASRANCAATAQNVELTGGLTQSQLNEGLRNPFGKAFWEGSIFKSGTEIVIETDGVRDHPSGVVAQEAVASLDVGTAGVPSRARMVVTILITPGRTYSVTCATKVDHFDPYRTAFRKVADSLRIGAQTNANTVQNLDPSGVTATPVSTDAVLPELFSAANGAASAVAWEHAPVR